MTETEQNIERIINTPLPSQILSGTDPHVIRLEAESFAAGIQATARAARGHYLDEKRVLDGKVNAAEQERDAWKNKFPGQTPDQAKTAYDNATTEAAKVTRLEQQVRDAADEERRLKDALQRAEGAFNRVDSSHAMCPQQKQDLRDEADRRVRDERTNCAQLEREMNTITDENTRLKRGNRLTIGIASLLIGGAMFGLGRYSKDDSQITAQPPTYQSAPAPLEPYAAQQWRVKVQLNTPAGDNTWYNETSREALGHEFTRRALHFSPAMLEENRASLIVLDGVTEQEVARFFKQAQRDRNTTYTPRRIERILHNASGDETFSSAELTQLFNKLNTNQPLE